MVVKSNKLLVPVTPKPTMPSGRPVPTCHFVTITPALAIEWLERNTLNRFVRDTLVAELGRDMLAGRWRGHNGEAIRFDSQGRLVDGQHRLWACVNADVPFISLVVEGIDPEDYDTIGIGRKKSFVDFMREEKNRTLLSSVVRLVFVWESGRLSMEMGSRSSTTASIKEMQETLVASPDIREAVNHVASRFGGLRGLVSQSYVSLVYYAAIRTGSKEKAESFLTTLRDGLGLDELSPIYHLRKFLQVNAANRRKAPQQHVLALFVKAWNLFLTGRKVGLLRIRADEEFPVLRRPGDPE